LNGNVNGEPRRGDWNVGTLPLPGFNALTKPSFVTVTKHKATIKWGYMEIAA